MHKTNGAGHIANMYVNEDVALSRPPTEVPAVDLNAFQEELVNIATMNGETLLTPGTDTFTQARDAIITKIRNMINGGDYKDSVRFTTTANIVLTGLGTQAGGDWPAALTAGERILVKNQTAGAENGIWIAAAGAWARATDADTGAELNSGAIIPVESGTLNADTNWQLATDGVVIIGTTGLAFIQIFGAQYFHARDEKANGTNAGTSTAGSQVRTLNTLLRNTIAGASLSANNITLPAGTYRVYASAPMAGEVIHKLFLQNVTDTLTLFNGANEDSSGTATTRSTINGSFTLAAQKVINIQHYTSAGVVTFGLGSAVSSGLPEVYAEIIITKET